MAKIARILLAGDVAVAAACVAALTTTLPFFGNGQGMSFLVFPISTVIGQKAGGSYGDRMYRRRPAELIPRVLAGLGASAFFASAVVLYLPSYALSRSAVIAYHLLAIPVFVAWRIATLNRIRGSLAPEPVAVVGRGKGTAELVDVVTKENLFRLAMVLRPQSSGAIAISRTRNGVSTEPVLPAKTATLIADAGVKLIVFASSDKDAHDKLHRHLNGCKRMDVDLLDSVAFLEMLTRRFPIQHIESWRPSFSYRFPRWDPVLEQRLKRLLDIVVSVVGLLLALPVMFTIAVVLRLCSGSPVIFKQSRTGFRNRPFTMYKFRSMKRADPHEIAYWTQENDPRITKLGFLLRKTHLDELPQLWNVLKGDMSLVGPRPESEDMVKQLRQQVPGYDIRHMKKPGVTGWAQVQYRYGSSVGDARKKLQYDLYYVRHGNFIMDLGILLRTLRVVFTLWGSR